MCSQTEKCTRGGYSVILQISCTWALTRPPEFRWSGPVALLLKLSPCDGQEQTLDPQTLASP